MGRSSRRSSFYVAVMIGELCGLEKASGECLLMKRTANFIFTVFQRVKVYLLWFKEAREAAMSANSASDKSLSGPNFHEIRLSTG